ncbi:MAG: hypothetical protein AB7G11_02310 [Phycisphaerales bacterium]
MTNSRHFTDDQGNPAGGQSYGRGFTIEWQNGPLGRGEHRQAPNGAFVEDVIGAAIDRLEYFQRGKFACDANAEAVTYLHLALRRLEARTAEREARGVEGTLEP